MRTLRASFVVLGLLLVAGCQREWLPPRPGELKWTPDTVRFDSLFSTVLSPTQRLWIYNPHAYPVRLRRVYLARGSQSSFRFIWNGLEGPIEQAGEIPGRDSILVFLQLRDTVPYNQTRSDDLVLEGEDGAVQRVPLQATLVAAYVYRDFGFDSVTLSLPSDKPIIIDGYFYVGPQATLRIVAGTRLYFSGRRWETGPFAGELASGIYVAGKLEVLGLPGLPVTFQGWRLESYYAQAPGQWQGLWFLSTARDCRINYAHIRQASIGIRIDSSGSVLRPKLTLEGCLLQDIANYGVLGVGVVSSLPTQPILQAVNTLIHSCGQANVALVGGGRYELIHCTLLYNQGDIRRGQTALVVTDYLRTESGLQTYDLDLYMLNSAIWSTKEDAVVLDLRGAQPVRRLEGCALRQREPLSGQNIVYLTDFGLGPAEEQYPLRPESPLINAGTPLPGLIPPTDRLGHPRDTQPDIGCYEYLR